MDDMFWAMYSWIKQDKATREGYRDWLKMVKIWYSKLLKGGDLIDTEYKK